MFLRSRNPFSTFLLSYHVQVISKIHGQLAVQEVLRGTDDFVLLIFTISSVFMFSRRGIHFWHSYWATMFRWPRKSRSISGSRGSQRYWWLCLMDFHNFFSIYVFEVKKSISDIPTELSCSSDLENPGQLPVQEALRGTDDFVLWIFTISSVFMFSMSRNPFLTFLLSHHVSGDLKNLGKLPVQEVLRGTDDFVLWIFILSSVFMFSRSKNPFLTFLLSYHVWVTLKIQVNLRFSRYWWFCLKNFWNFFTIHVFKVKESIVDIPTELPCLGDLENLGQLPSDSRVTQRYWWLYLMDFYNFFTIYVVKVKESIADIPTELQCLSDLENPSQLPVWEVLVILS